MLSLFSDDERKYNNIANTVFVVVWCLRTCEFVVIKELFVNLCLRYSEGPHKNFHRFNSPRDNTVVTELAGSCRPMRYPGTVQALIPGGADHRGVGVGKPGRHE